MPGEGCTESGNPACCSRDVIRLSMASCRALSAESETGAFAASAVDVSKAANLASIAAKRCASFSIDAFCCRETSHTLNAWMPLQR
jgi:hypothetical protein